MTFSASIPLANDPFAQSQLDILTNFSRQNVLFGADHVNFDASLPVLATLGYAPALADEGKHTIIRQKMMNAATGLNTVVTNANEGAIIAKETVAGQRVESIYKYQGGAAANTVVLSCIKAFALCPGTGTYGPAAPTNGYNVTSTQRDDPSGYVTVIMPAGVVTSTNYAVIALTSGEKVVPNYVIDSATQFRLRPVDAHANKKVNVASISFVVLQFAG